MICTRWREPAAEGKRAQDRDTIERWARAEGTDLETEAMRAKQNLINVDRARE